MTQSPQITQRVLALGLAAVMSLAMLAGVDGLAVQQHSGGEIARSEQPVQRIVIASTRLPRG